MDIGKEYEAIRSYVREKHGTELDVVTENKIISHALFAAIGSKYSVKYMEEDELLDRLIESHVNHLVEEAVYLYFPGGLARKS
jgi:hypothetical protein